MKFRNWLEANWDTVIPKDDLKYNKDAVDGFVNQMANIERNAAAVYAMLTRHTFTSSPRYIGKIGNNFLTFDDPKLQNIKGDVVTALRESHFKFFYSGAKAGNIEIIHPPVVYDDTDRHALYGIVVHELRHAQDWLTPGNQFKPVEYYEFDFNLYEQKNLTEARAYAEQLIQLLRKVGSAKKVVSAFSQQPSLRPIPGAAYFPPNVQKRYVKNSPFVLPANLLKFAQELLFKFESDVREAFDPIFAPTAAISQNIEVEREQAAQLVKQIIEKLLFRNFIIKP